MAHLESVIGKIVDLPNIDEALRTAQDKGQAPLSIEGHTQKFILKRSHRSFQKWSAFLSEQQSILKTKNVSLPIYVGADPATLNVELLLVPLPRGKRIIGDQHSDRIKVNFVSKSNPNWRNIVSLLQSRRQLLVAVHPFDMEILTVQPDLDTDAYLADSYPKPRMSQEVRQISEVSFESIQKVFQTISDFSGIPFRYVTACCTARAHQMCRIMLTQGLKPCKVWNFGTGAAREESTLQVQTPLVPSGYVKWLFHVAPVLKCSSDATGQSAYYVIDPSLFRQPVTVDEWCRLQQDQFSHLRLTGPKIYYHPFQATGKTLFDNDFRSTDRFLSAAQANLNLIS